MSRLIDLTGKRFGKLTVIKRADNDHPSKNPKWLCQCDCGNETNVTYNNLGTTKAVDVITKKRVVKEAKKEKEKNIQDGQEERQNIFL